MKRSAKLRLVGGELEVRDDVPATRDQCPERRPCGHIRCKWHLWTVVGPDRPGRRHPGERPRETTLRLDIFGAWPVPMSCGLDAIDRAAAEGWSRKQMAAVLGVQPSGFGFLLAKSIRKIRDTGLNLREFLGGPDAGNENESSR